ncbi:STAS domain-containing protein [Solirubrobacter ginsenosidimutans]|uniref:Anti-sigma factor antagonist n=1 Tax=Solirubrobacter ginsenosidimutans TaxID=490573 RepID=A0A9X3N4Y6_9ACTN|nr:STAS domain-containing protein [Solirubrobacter ginsenosidimutans]MDA0167336.1 STAS domain-containing protein [Solirubrobacter ginsenosidimutans]
MSDDATGNSTSHFTLTTMVRDSSLELIAAGELDMTAAFKFESRVDALLSAGGVQAVVVDLAQVDFVDSAGLGALLSVRDHARRRGIDLQLARISDPVRKLIDLTGIGDLAGDVTDHRRR